MTRFEADATVARATCIGRTAEFFSQGGTATFGPVPSKPAGKRQGRETKKHDVAEERNDGGHKKNDFPTRKKTPRSEGGVAPKIGTSDRQPNTVKVSSVLPIQGLSELSTDLP